MKRVAVFSFGLVVYLMFLGVFAYSIGFVGNLLVPRSIDHPVSMGLGTAALVNVLLLGLFAVQHSGMARPGFKRWLNKYIPQPAERSFYVLMTNLAMIVLFLFWQPMPLVIWEATAPWARAILWTLYGGGWLLVLLSTCMISHFDLFGLRQTWLYFRGQPYQPLKFVTPGLYRYIRHPLHVGWFTVFWAAPTMTLGHLMFALVTTTYILLAIRWEERDLLAAFGETYAEYRQRVRMFVPRLF